MSNFSQTMVLRVASAWIDRQAAGDRPIGKAQYKGRTYNLLYLGPTKYGQKARLQFMDGSKDFWVDANLVSVLSDSSGKSSPGKASPKQVDFALKLIRRLGDGWYDSDMGQGMSRPPSSRELALMSSRDISDFIDSLQSELH